MVISSSSSFLAVRNRRGLGGSFRMGPVVRSVRVGRAEVRRAEREQSVDYEAGEREHR
jgi:hypothetical protein